MPGTRATYSQLLQSWPVSVKFVTSLVLAAASNVVAQIPSGRIDVRIAVKYGLLDAPPHSHFWYMLLEAFVPSPFARTVIDTAIYGPLTSTYFYIGSTLLIDGGTWADAKAKMAGGRFLRTVFAGWKFWPLVQYGNQRWVPFHYRTLTMDIAGFVWNVYMSVATRVSGGVSHVEPETPRGYTAKLRASRDSDRRGFTANVRSSRDPDGSPMVSYYSKADNQTEPVLAAQYSDPDRSSLVSYYSCTAGKRTEPVLAAQYS